MSASPSTDQQPTAAEVRAAARRRKILEQGDNRLKKILGLPPGDTSTSSPHLDTTVFQSEDITSSSSVTSGYTLTQRNSREGSKVQDRESTPPGLLTEGSATTASSNGNESCTFVQNTSTDFTDLHRLLLVMLCALIGSFVESNVIALFLAVEPVLFILFFASSLRKKNNPHHQHLSQPNRFVKHAIATVFSDLIVFSFASIMIFAISLLT